MAEQNNELKPDKTVIKDLGLGNVGQAEPISVDVKNNRIVRIRPLHFDEKYTREEIGPWKIEARGKSFEPLMKAVPPYFALGYKNRIYSPNRILYPLKRVDWDPKGERNTQNRGKSKFKRISWNEATDIIAAEIQRIHKIYGPYSVLVQSQEHGESKTVHATHGAHKTLLKHLGGYTLQMRQPDSWEGWYWGSMHVWGTGHVGFMKPSENIVTDISQNTDLMVWWGGDMETTPQAGGQMCSRLLFWWRELGIKSVYICPDLNYAAAVHADKWIPVLPNTDAALQLAIIYIWIMEGTYDKEYVKTHVVGFDKLTDYVLGTEDGEAKTPEWATPRCGVPEWTIKALAREWAAKTTTIGHSTGGSFIRGPYSHEPGRLETYLLGMQGLGKPGIHQFRRIAGWPRSIVPGTVWKAKRGHHFGTVDAGHLPPDSQFIVQTHVQKNLLNNKPQEWYGSGAIFAGVEDQFKKYTFPFPKDKGGSEIHMVWTDGPCYSGCWNDSNAFLENIKSPKIEFVLAQHPWLENDCLFADIILPVNTKFEEEDINGGWDMSQYHIITLQDQAINTIEESKSDYEVVGEIAKKLGKYPEYTENRSIQEWIKYGYETSGVQDMISWEELKEKKYYIIPTAKDWKKDPVGMIKFYQNPENNPLETPSGKLEFYSARLAKNFPDDKERGPLAHWVVGGSGWTHDESLWGERVKKYPLLLVSNHPRWRFHVQGDDMTWLREIPSCKVKGFDGYLYEPVWINPIDAVNRGIKQGDIVKVYNERGAVLGGAMVWERIRPGAVSQDHGARLDLITEGLDRGGSNNLISPCATSSKNAQGEATSGYLVEVEKVSPEQMEEWKSDYPEAFSRKYDPGAGLCFNGWVEE